MQLQLECLENKEHPYQVRVPRRGVHYLQTDRNNAGTDMHAVSYPEEKLQVRSEVLAADPVDVPVF